MLCQQKCSLLPHTTSFRPICITKAASKRRLYCTATHRRRQDDIKVGEGSGSIWHQQCALRLISAVALGLCCISEPSLAEIQTVAPRDATSYARPLKAEPVKKGRIWGLFLLGATGLFGGAVALEKNSSFFPAIAKANEALAATKAAQKKKQTEDEEQAKQDAIEVRSEEAVLQGLADARSNVDTASTSKGPELIESSQHDEKDRINIVPNGSQDSRPSQNNGKSSSESQSSNTSSQEQKGASEVAR